MENNLNKLLAWARQFNKTAKIEDGYIITEDAYLNCSSKNLTELPDNIDKLKVVDFNCSSNQITELPDSIGNMKVDTFDCSNNYIIKLPDSIGNMKVKGFYCWYNNLTKLPNSIGNMKANSFYCSYNQLEEDHIKPEEEQCYRTVEDIPVTITSKKGREPYNIIGYIGDSCVVQAWNKNGQHHLGIKYKNIVI